MMKSLKKCGLFLTTCFILQASDAVSQITTFSDVQSNAEVTAQIARSNADARAEYRRLHPTEEDLELETNAMRSWKPPEPWPEPSKRKAIFEHCAEVLESAIDSNQLEWVCSNMTTNLPVIRKFQNQAAKDGPITVTFVTNDVVISHFRNFSQMAISNLDEFALLLSSPNLESYVGPGYCAEISNPTNFFFWLFWPDDLVRLI